MEEGKLIVEKLLKYARTFMYLDELDVIYFRNLLLKELNLSEPYLGDADLDYVKNLTVPDDILNELCDYACENKIIENYERDKFSAYIMGILTEKPSEINRNFKEIREKIGAQAACDYLYNLSIKNNYIQKTAIDKNIMWLAEDGGNTLEITINLSKPEKDNKEIAKLLSAAKKSNYPACLLCKENEGFAGTLTHPARGNIRTISMKLGGEEWFMQYSPYAYYNEHCIVINKEHVPMNVTPHTLDKLFDFVTYLPNYFIGSNASLPIVGGSILNHEHFQGGRHIMPMHNAKDYKYFKSENFQDVTISIVDWYNSVIRLCGTNRKSIIELGSKIIEFWKVYDDESCDIISHTGNVPHNAVTPILRILNDGRYCLDLILRNNRTSDEYPDGIFHAHPQYHNIKKEGIGLIEVMGLFILPGRLKKQTAEISDILCGVTKYDESEINNENHPLFVHRNMIKTLVDSYGLNNSRNGAEKYIKSYINSACIGVLGCTAVFKKDEKGRLGFENFLNKVL